MTLKTENQGKSNEAMGGFRALLFSTAVLADDVKQKGSDCTEAC